MVKANNSSLRGPWVWFPREFIDFSVYLVNDKSDLKLALKVIPKKAIKQKQFNTAHVVIFLVKLLVANFSDWNCLFNYIKCLLLIIPLPKNTFFQKCLFPKMPIPKNAYSQKCLFPKIPIHKISYSKKICITNNTCSQKLPIDKNIWFTKIYFPKTPGPKNCLFSKRPVLNSLLEKIPVPENDGSTKCPIPGKAKFPQTLYFSKCPHSGNSWVPKMYNSYKTWSCKILEI